MKKYIIETLLQELATEIRAAGIDRRDGSLFDLVKKRLELGRDMNENNLAEMDALAFLDEIEKGKPEYKWDIPKMEPQPALMEDEKELNAYQQPEPGVPRGAGDDYPVVDITKIPDHGRLRTNP